MNLYKLKYFLSAFFFILGIIAAILTYNFSNINSYGHLTSNYKKNFGEEYSPGVDSSNDGVATGLGIISGFSFLSSTLLLTSFNNKQKG